MGVRLNDSANGRIVESKAFSNGIKKAPVERVCKCLIFKLWAQLGLNQRPPDYESGAANQLSYGPCFLPKFYIFAKRVQN